MELSHTRGQAKSPSSRLVPLLRRYPLGFYFLFAFGFTWAYELTVYRVLLTPGYSLGVALLDLGFTFGPTLAAFVMTVITQGYAGLRQLLRHYVLWRVGLRWYVLALLGIPAMVLLGVLPLPEALSDFRLPALSFWPTYLLLYPLFFVAEGALGEEPGWRGFALPRLQQRLGALVGTLILGVLWGLWHLPLFFIPGSDQYALSFTEPGFVGHLIALCVFAVGTSAIAVVLTWVFNNTRGSLLLAMLLHASNNAASFAIATLFPSFAEASLSALVLSWVVVWVVAALLVIAATRGRLSYERYLRETELSEEQEMAKQYASS